MSNERASNFVDAFKYYQAAIEAEPLFVDTYFELGAMLVKVGDFEGALQCYEDAIEIQPTDLAGHENLMLIFWRVFTRVPRKNTLISTQRPKQELKKLSTPERRYIRIVTLRGNLMMGKVH